MDCKKGGKEERKGMNMIPNHTPFFITKQTSSVVMHSFVLPILPRIEPKLSSSSSNEQNEKEHHYDNGTFVVAHHQLNISLVC
jgi:hypothetical protein